MWAKFANAGHGPYKASKLGLARSASHNIRGRSQVWKGSGLPPRHAQVQILPPAPLREVPLPPAAKRDELVTVLLERLDRFESALSAVQQAIARIEQAEEQTRSVTSAATLRMDGLEKRLNDLESAKDRAEGAAAGVGWLWKLLTAAGLIGGGAAVRHWLGGGK